MYREYRDNIYNRVLSQFETLVNEREDLINKDIPLEGYEYNKILMKLREDPRAQRIERYPDKRDKIIRAKVKELKHKDLRSVVGILRTVQYTLPDQPL
jgi:hypothetical protein